MIYLLFSIVIFFSCFSIFYAFQKKDILNPLILFYIPFLIQIVIHYLKFHKNYNISSETYLIFSLGLLFFGLGYLFFGFLIKENKYNAHMHSNDELYINKQVYNFFILWGIIGLLLGFFEMIKFGRSGVAGQFFSSVRWHVNYGEGYNFITKYSVVPMHIICCYDLLNQKAARLKKYLHIFIYTLLILIGTARTGIILSILALTYIWILNNKVNNRRLSFKQKSLIILITILVITAFISFANATNKLFIKDEFFLYLYFGFPINSFDTYILNNPSVTSGAKVGGILFEILSKVNLVNYNNIDDLLARVGQFNVYSYISDPYLDFGSFGVISVSFSLGILTNYFYNKNLFSGGKWTIVYATFANSILISFYSYTFSLTYYIYIVIFLFIFVKNRTSYSMDG
ncbi:O-antigen polymerase [Streptococcus suis]|uniref:O-antigen polymerase n=1 Tax=Streptococcus suis TaxID=1307 RepID=UPI000CF3B8C6|nr:O-antigen polymerase [Streptococcus suis]